MKNFKITLVIAFVALLAVPQASSAQGLCRAQCQDYVDEYNNTWHINPIVSWWEATDMCDGDGCHDEWLPGLCAEVPHVGCAGSLMGMPSQEAIATNNTEQLRKLLATKDTPLRLTKDGTAIQLLGCNGKVVMQKPLTKEMQLALKS